MFSITSHQRHVTKITMRYHFTLFRMASLIKQTTSAGEDVEKRDTVVHCWWECRLVQLLWKLWNFLKKIKMGLPFDPAIPLLGLYPKNPETPILKNLCTPMFIAMLFTVAKCRNQSKCPSVNEWIKNCGTFTQWNTMQQKERRNSYPLQQCGWNWRALC